MSDALAAIHHVPRYYTKQNFNELTPIFNHLYNTSPCTTLEEKAKWRNLISKNIRCHENTTETDF